MNASQGLVEVQATSSCAASQRGEVDRAVHGTGKGSAFPGLARYIAFTAPCARISGV